MERPELFELPQLSDRLTFIYLEHCQLNRDDSAVTVIDKDGTIPVSYTHLVFHALDKALFHATEYERVCADDTVCHTSPLLRRLKLNSERQEVNVTKYLPDDWPWWQVPDYTNVKAEIMSDPRWNEWVKKTQK